MGIYALKPAFQSLLRPLVRKVATAHITANQVTLSAGVISIAIGAWVLTKGQTEPLVFLAIPIWMLVRMAFNAADGMLAREFGQKSPLGAYLNELCDVVSDAALYFPFALLPGSNMALITLVIVLSALSELTGTVAVMTGASRRYDGPMGKSDRAAVFGVLGLLVALGVNLSGALNAIWLILALLIVLTIANRIRRGLQEIRQ